MNRRTDETRKNKKQEQAKQSVAGNNLDEQEAKETIINLMDYGLTYRYIVGTPFTFNNRVRRFSMSQVSNWVKERDRLKMKLGEDILASKVFRLFEKGKGPVQPVVEL